MTNIQLFQTILSALGVAFIALAFAACLEWKYKIARRVVMKKIREIKRKEKEKYTDIDKKKQ